MSVFVLIVDQGPWEDNNIAIHSIHSSEKKARDMAATRSHTPLVEDFSKRIKGAFCYIEEWEVE